jgi:hypothetical protein
MTGDPIGDALRADADAARQELRDLGYVCPSCGKNAADIYGTGHRYDRLGDGIVISQQVIKCADGQPVHRALLDYDQVKAVANIDLLDALNRAEDEAFAKIIGTGPAKFTGLLDVLPGGLL